MAQWESKSTKAIQLLIMFFLVGWIDISAMSPSVHLGKHFNSGSICPFDPRIFYSIGIGEGNPYMGIGKGL